MKKVLVRYKVKKNKATENEAFVKEVFRQLHEKRPKDFHYAAYKLKDGVHFIHLASFTGDGGNPLHGLPAFSNFLANIQGRCEEIPVVENLMEIGSYQRIGEEIATE